MKEKNKRYVVLGASTGMTLVCGILYIWGVISKALVEQLNWTSKEASLPYTVATISFVIAMVIFGDIQDKKGPRMIGTIGGFLMGFGLILSGLTLSPKMLILSMGIISGCGIGILNVTTTPPAVKWFPPEKKGMITGIVVGGVSVSSMLYSPLANYLIKTQSISKTFIVIGCIALCISVFLAQFLKNPPEEHDIKSQKGFLSNQGFTWKEMLKTKQFYMVWMMLGLSSSAGLMIIGHISNIAKVQAKWEGGFILVILLAIFNTLGRFLGGTISDKIGRSSLMRIIFVMQGVNMFWFSQYNNVGLLAIGAAIAGLCYGATFSVFPATIADVYGMKNFGMNFGLMFTAWGFGGVIGPMTGAAIFDMIGNYNTAYLVSGSLLVLAFITTFIFDKSKKGIKIFSFDA
ncbi:OFA family MFS transporter [Clostridiaceae bacterium 35-E11]